MLTDKAKKAFRIWLGEPFVFEFTDFDDMPEIIKYSYVIKWFDSVKINIHTDITSSYYIGKIYATSLEFPDYAEKYYHNIDRSHVISHLILKANEIYNTKFP